MNAARRSRHYLLLSALFVFSLSTLHGFAQATNRGIATSQRVSTSAITWATRAIAGLTGGSPVNSATLQGTVTRDDSESEGSLPVTLQANGNSTSRIDISSSEGLRSLLRSIDSDGRPSGTWIDAHGRSHDLALHNCWTDAVWFFPALSMLSAYADPSMVFVDLGQEQRSGTYVEHLQVYRNVSGKTPIKTAQIAQLSTVDYYLDSTTAVPIAIAFADHANDDALTNIAIEVDFSDFRQVGTGIVPYQVTRLQNGSPQFQISITTVTLNQ